MTRHTSLRASHTRTQTRSIRGGGGGGGGVEGKRQRSIIGTEKHRGEESLPSMMSPRKK